MQVIPGRNTRQLERVSPWKTTMTSGHDVSEYLGTLGLVKSYFFTRFLKKNKKIQKKNILVFQHPHPEDQVICLFAGLLGNPDMPLIPHSLPHCPRLVSESF